METEMSKILLAEDDDNVRAFVARALAIGGHDVVEAEDGGLALEALGDEEGRFDLLLSDIKMPVMDGIALALAAAARYPDLTILLMTGFADQRERAHGLEALIHDVVPKPFSLAEITAKVEEALAGRPAAIVSLAQQALDG
jgi:CheY-like chemotaxis protein